MSIPHPLAHPFLRMVVVSSAWLAFAAIGFVVYATYIHDVGATFWVMQVFLLPVALPLALALDYLLVRQPWLSGRYGLVSGLDSAFAILLWFWPLRASGLLLAVFGWWLLTQRWPMIQAFFRRKIQP